mmetsp:Transcript_48642/g.147966  ORF Transcript_48642/g.147966 Transcript_48642/m.147966 type:complete len:215 (+) Transcript_48642:273-917(+)
MPAIDARGRDSGRGLPGGGGAASGRCFSGFGLRRRRQFDEGGFARLHARDNSVQYNRIRGHYPHVDRRPRGRDDDARSGVHPRLPADADHVGEGICGDVGHERVAYAALLRRRRVSGCSGGDRLRPEGCLDGCVARAAADRHVACAVCGDLSVLGTAPPRDLVLELLLSWPHLRARQPLFPLVHDSAVLPGPHILLSGLLVVLSLGQVAPFVLD